ncbi:MAG: FtsH protease activity modulator HflK [Pseudomonadota bacterium]
MKPLAVHIDKLFIKSPWDNDSNERENIFAKQRKNGSQFFNNFKFEFNPKTILLACVALVLLWLASGIYPVKEGEEAVVVRFGKFVRTGTPGLNYHLPEPFEKVVIERVNQSRRVEIGYRSTTSTKGSRSEAARYITAESIMLTGDENLMDLNCDVMWHIRDLEAFVFNIANPEVAVKNAAESAIREVVGNTPISSILSNQKQEIADKIERLIQKILDQYKAGIVVEKVQLLKAEPPTDVIDSYRDVQTSKADKEKEINQAQSYSNDILPKARGRASEIIQEAEGYKQEVISKAEGDSKRFSAILDGYLHAKQVTKDRLYLETVEEVLKGSNKTIISAEGLLPHMNIAPK